MTKKEAAKLGYDVIAASPFEVGLVKNGKGIRTWFCIEFDRRMPSLDHAKIQEAIRINENMNKPRVAAEKPGDRPHYFPGDVIKAKDGSIGIITHAESGGVEWNEFEEITERMANGRPPQYSVDEIPGCKLSKCAWWEAREWSEVLKGPLHQVLEGSKVWQKNLLRLEMVIGKL